MILLNDLSFFSFWDLDYFYNYFIEIISGLEDGKTVMDKRRRIETKTGVLDSMGAVNYESDSPHV